MAAATAEEEKVAADEICWNAMVPLITKASETAQQVTNEWGGICYAADQARCANKKIEDANSKLVAAEGTRRGKKRAVQDAQQKVTQRIAAAAQARELFAFSLKALREASLAFEAAVPPAVKALEANDDLMGKRAADNTTEAAEEEEERPAKKARADEA